MNDIKLLIVDTQATSVFDKVKEYLKSSEDEGIEIALLTERTQGYLNVIKERLKLDSPLLISEGGAIIKSTKRKTVNRFFLKSKESEQISSMYEELTVMLSDNITVTLNETNILLECPNLAKAYNVLYTLEILLDDYHLLKFSYINDDVIEIVSKEYSREDHILRFIEKEDIKPNQVMIIGDDDTSIYNITPNRVKIKSQEELKWSS